MSDAPLVQRSTAVRRRVREQIPFRARIGIRRLPHLVRWALAPPATMERSFQVLPHVHATRSSPLARPGTTYERSLQQAKEQNVRRAARAIHGLIVPPGAIFSWHAHVGPPLSQRGFAAGPELHDGELAIGLGGGLCQVANLVYWLAVHGGQTLVERHRHQLDLFPDQGRTVPFGLGATVFWPHRDLRFANPLDHPVQLVVTVKDGKLQGALHMPVDPGFRVEVVETEHRFVERGDGIWRENRLVRRVHRDGQHEDRPLAEHRARVCYTVKLAKRARSEGQAPEACVGGLDEERVQQLAESGEIEPETP